MGRRYRKGDRIATLWHGVMIGEYPLCREGKSGAKHEVEGFLMRRVCEDEVTSRDMLRPRMTLCGGGTLRPRMTS